MNKIIFEFKINKTKYLSYFGIVFALNIIVSIAV